MIGTNDLMLIVGELSPRGGETASCRDEKTQQKLGGDPYGKCL